MSSTASSWIKVAQGFKLVAQAASKIAIEEGTTVAAQASRHSLDLAKNARNATAHVATTMNFNSNNANAMNNVSSVDIINNEIKKNFNAKNIEEESSSSSSSSSSGSSTKEEIKSHDVQSSGDHEPLHVEANTNDRKNNTNSDIIHQNVEISRKEDVVGTIENEENEENEVVVNQQQRLNEGQAVPSTRIGRAMGFASLGKFSYFIIITQKYIVKYFQLTIEPSLFLFVFVFVNNNSFVKGLA